MFNVWGLIAGLAMVWAVAGCDDSGTKPKPGASAAGDVPLGLGPVPVPDDNPMSAKKVELGRMLYFDTRLSKDGTISCATCHDPNTGWAEPRATSEGIGGQIGGRNAPTVINAAYLDSQFWDGRVPTLEAQALGPIENPIEMGHKLEDLVGELSKIEGYKKLFQEVFSTDVTKEGIAKAIAAFERTVLSGNSAYDRFKKGDKSALNEAQKRGHDLFMESCSGCHRPPTFSNGRFYNAGIGMDKPEPDVGREKVTGDAKDKGGFRVVPLRDATDTGPYFHDGSVASLEEAVIIMAGGGIDNPNLSGMVKKIRDAKLTEENVKDLVAFIGALSGDYPKTTPPKLP